RNRYELPRTCSRLADSRAHVADGRRFPTLDARHRWRGREAGFTGAPGGHGGEAVMQDTQIVPYAVPQAYRILPELFLTITGVLIMLIEPLMPPGMTRKPIGFLALAGVIGA